MGVWLGNSQWQVGRGGGEACRPLTTSLHGLVKFYRGTSDLDLHIWCGIFIPLCGQIIIRKNRTKNAKVFIRNISGLMSND